MVHASRDGTRRVIRAGFDRHVPKPYAPNDLLAAVAAVVGARGRKPRAEAS